MADLANIAAATAAGYKLTETDAGSGRSPRYRCYLAKWITGEPGQSGFEFRADGYSDVSSTAARTNALAALNGQRKYRFGNRPSRAGGSDNTGAFAVSDHPGGAPLTADQQ